MNRLSKLILAMGLIGAAGPCMAVDISVNAMDTRVLPVFVQVDAHGKVTRILPAQPLAPKFDRMLDSTVRQWITKPAVVNGHAIDSSIILRVALKVHARDDGRYDLVYDYVSSMAVPMASSSAYWHWTNDHLALVTGPDWSNQRHWNGNAASHLPPPYPYGGYNRSDTPASAPSSSGGGHAPGGSRH